jgi:hypothetical protein
VTNWQKLTRVKALATPVLLQRLLASMREEKPVGVTITYAVLTVAFRLLAAQLQVFNLWYQRRAYERSRGELITMLYEKTLNRKIMGAKQEAKEEQTNGHTNTENGQTPSGGSEQSPEIIKNDTKSWFGRWIVSIRSTFSRKSKKDVEKEKVAASMGKILNLMRNDVY